MTPMSVIERNGVNDATYSGDANKDGTQALIAPTRRVIKISKTMVPGSVDGSTPVHQQLFVGNVLTSLFIHIPHQRCSLRR